MDGDSGGWIELSVKQGDRFLLYVLVHSDGTMNRSGAVDGSYFGAATGADGPVLGMTAGPVYQGLLTKLTSELAGLSGEHDLGGAGEKRELALSVVVGNRGLRWLYRAAAGAAPLPDPVAAYVALVIAASDQWLDESGALGAAPPAV